MESNQRTVFKHIPNPDRKGGVTICYIFQRKELIAIGFALCSKQDCYNRARGRLISQGRAEKALRTGKLIITHQRHECYASRSWPELRRLNYALES